MQNALVRAEVQYALQTSIVKVYPNERGADSLHQPHHMVEYSNRVARIPLPAVGC